MDLQATHTISISSLKNLQVVDNEPYLSVSIGNDMGKLFHIHKKRMSVGRSPEADIVINDEMISWDHFFVDYVEGEVYFQDNDSTNGVFVNGVKSESGQLKAGANLQIGDTVMKLEMLAPYDVELRQGLFQRANFDLLTGAYNRHYFMDYAVKEIALAQREQLAIKLIMLDLDHFKDINDSLGHPTGDYVLREISHLIDGAMREYDLLCRYGGEEFILMLMGKVSLVDVEKICERIRCLVEEHSFEFGGELLSVTASFGVCYLENVGGHTVESVIDMADKALYVSKENGRNMVTVSTDIPSDAESTEISSEVESAGISSESELTG